jgi:hypothetical protein
MKLWCLKLYIILKRSIKAIYWHFLWAHLSRSQMRWAQRDKNNKTAKDGGYGKFGCLPNYCWMWILAIDSSNNLIIITKSWFQQQTARLSVSITHCETLYLLSMLVWSDLLRAGIKVQNAHVLHFPWQF